MTIEIKKAINHIKEFYPQVNMVVFNKQGQWMYCSDDFDAPTFSDKINQSILEDAADSVIKLPSIFQLD